jgi:hypothetical protein
MGRSVITAKKATLSRPSFHKLNFLLGHVVCSTKDCEEPAVISVQRFDADGDQSHLYRHLCVECAGWELDQVDFSDPNPPPRAKKVRVKLIKTGVNVEIEPGTESLYKEPKKMRKKELLDAILLLDHLSQRAPRKFASVSPVRVQSLIREFQRRNK